MTAAKPKPKSRKSTVVMPPDTCGGCYFCHPHLDDEAWRLCLALPPLPVVGIDGNGRWPRGGEVQPDEPRCIFFMPKTGVQ